ncbi:sugar transferase [Halomonas kenyensis]|uniref:Sugar transferase n=2 Tax=Billgrantia kenyensis TaxID=321266 RepID=A0A7V9W0B2_9GAMM|nr:sugar transferase [Halomonas kenyensis]MBA2778682.1 sugar transferase [Halomonas kenyensis]MCG6661744.1 sugar transferase [Halomonas kenyensis]
MQHQRRRSRFSERLLLSRRVQFATGLCVVVLAPALWLWGWSFWTNSAPSQGYSMAVVTLAYALPVILALQLSRYPGMRPLMVVLPGLAMGFGVALGGAIALELLIDPTYVGSAMGLAALWSLAHYQLVSRYSILKLAVVPYGRANSMSPSPNVEWCPLLAPSLVGHRVDGVVVDMKELLPKEWQGFLADCTISGIPIYHATTVQEMINGRVPLDQLFENQYGSLRPRDDYDVIKRLMDILGALILIPVMLPLMLIVAVLIRHDSSGPSLFTQQRMGFHCRPFTLYKFRTMYVDQQGSGFTSEGYDPRITRIGHVLRKYRIDELPQLFNVLKGDMSLIGPRPESMNLTDWYEKDVPFFFYRHMVKPGITGWAQVEQGYAAEVDGMVRKIEYDFYYIKNISFWLDMLIVIKTVKIILTGFGSR